MPLSIVDLATGIVRPILRQLDLWSPAAENLLLGTAAAESGLVHLRQVGGGPALGLWQMEPATHDDLWVSVLHYSPVLRERVECVLAPWLPRHEQLVWNHGYACVMTRLQYRRFREPLPDARDVEGLGAYWLRYYNRGGKGTIEHWVRSYGRLVTPALDDPPD